LSLPRRSTATSRYSPRRNATQVIYADLHLNFAGTFKQ
jgi:hypothetical protein